ncbi:META domain-containing protein [Larkinella soli]|uniref:META domain-containing protein n=1 Tax=Larkinella soli TaxID=1770527 RepID=UPI000FFC5BE1|nr:META domain-containing protein [Larkinella soli]
MRTILALITGLFLMAAGCDRGSDSTVQPVSIETIAGKYRLAEPASKFEVTLEISPDSAGTEVKNAVAYRIGGRSSVNHYFGALTGSKTSDQVTISAIGSTKMAGPADAMQFEFDYFEKLRAVKRFEMAGNRLRLIAEGEKPGILTFEKTN